MKLNNRFIFGLLSILLAAVIAFVALPTIAKQTNGKTEIVRVTKPVLKGTALGRQYGDRGGRELQPSPQYRPLP